MRCVRKRLMARSFVENGSLGTGAAVIFSMILIVFAPTIGHSPVAVYDLSFSYTPNLL